MKRTLIAFFAIAITSTLLVYPASSQELKNDLPISIGDTRASVRARLGNPNRSSEAFDTFFDYGLSADYDAKGSVFSITATHLVSGTSFDGKILGVSLGDPVKQCVSLWGNSLKWEETPFGFSRAWFRYGGFLIELEVWRNDGRDPSFGSYKSGTIKEIKIRKDS